MLSPNQKSSKYQFQEVSGVIGLEIEPTTSKPKARWSTNWATWTGSDYLFWKENMYSKTSMAGASLGPCKFIRDMDSLSHWGLIMAPDQEAYGDNLGKSFWFSTQ